MASNGFYILANDPGDSYTDSPFTYTIITSGTMTGVTYSFGWEFTCDGVTTKETVASGLTSSTYTWAPTSVKFGPLMKKSQSGTLTIVVKTVNGRDIRYTRNFTLKLKESVKPAVSSIRIARTDPFNNQSVSNITTHKLSFNVAGLYGASQTVTVTIGDAKYTKEVAAVSGASATAVSFDIGSFDAGSSATLAKSIAISVIDARGRTGTASTSVMIYRYTPPAITKATVERNANEQPVLTFRYSYQDTVAGATNTLKQFYARCIVGTNAYQTDLKGKSSPQVLTGTYDISKSYTFLVLIQDSVRPSATIVKATLPSSNLVLDIGADGKTVTFFGTSPSSATKESLRIGDMALFAGDEIAIGKKSTSSVIDLCNGTGTIDNANPTSGYKRLAIKSNNSVEISATNTVFIKSENGTNSCSVEVGSNSVPWNPNGISGAWTKMHAKQGTREGSIDLTSKTIDILTTGSEAGTTGMSIISDTGIVDLCGQVRVSNGQLRVLNNIISEGGSFYLDNGKSVYIRGTDSTHRNILGMNSSNNVLLGWGPYDANVGYMRIHGGKGIRFITKTPAVEWKPYYEKNDSVSMIVATGGYITNSGRDVLFTIFLSKPIIGSPTVSAASVYGLCVRQATKYLYGSTASTYAKPSSYTVSLVGNGDAVSITAKMANTTNVTNNDSCGVYASITITFS